MKSELRGLVVGEREMICLTIETCVLRWSRILTKSSAHIRLPSVLSKSPARREKTIHFQASFICNQPLPASPASPGDLTQPGGPIRCPGMQHVIQSNQSSAKRPVATLTSTLPPQPHPLLGKFIKPSHGRVTRMEPFDWRRDC